MNMGVVKELWEMNSTINYLRNQFDEDKIGEDTMNDTIQAIMDDSKSNLESLANWYRNADDEKDKYAKAIKELQEKKKHVESQISFIKRLSNEIMSNLGVKKFSVGLSTFSTRPSQTLEVSDDAIIPEQYWKQQEPKLDKAQLKKDVKEGLQINGVILETHRNVTIK